MNDLTKFEAFGKIARLNRDCTITEKIDGTNAQVCIVSRLAVEDSENLPKALSTAVCETADFFMFAGSRNRWLQPEGSVEGKKGTDNFGFAAWVRDNTGALMGLGEGRHFGEWWGSKVQRGYGLEEKRFSLFDVQRWDTTSAPACCWMVPTLYQGPYSSAVVAAAIADLRKNGSYAAPFDSPEGVVVLLNANRTLYKVTLDNDGVPKGETR
jgi:hypothetical protein